MTDNGIEINRAVALRHIPRPPAILVSNRDCVGEVMSAAPASSVTQHARKLSSYADKLPNEAKVRYLQKLSLIDGVDPFEVSTSGGNDCPLPPVDASDIVSYLVLQTSFISAKQFKAHRSMEAYNQFSNGWVKDVRACAAVGEKLIVTGRVSRLSLRFLT